MNNIKIEEINLFLNQMLKLGKERNLTYHDIYKNLIKMRINNDSFCNIYFTDWLDAFKNKENINVTIDSNNKNYCRFNNKDTNNNYNYIKISLSIDHKYINEVIKIIFNYLSNNNIKHFSKVSNIDRINNCIIRINNINDSNNIIDFINKNEFINNSLRNSSPFSCNQNKISLEIDGRLSYNSILSDLIANYINHINNSNIYKEASLQSFRLYLNEIYQNYFVNKREINELKANYNNDLYIYNRFIDEKDYIKNYKEVLELIILNVNPNSDINSFYNYFNSLKNSKKIEIDKPINDILKKVVIDLIKRNGIKIAIKRFEMYLKTNNIKFINKKTRNLFIDRQEEIYNYIVNNYKSVNEMFNFIKNEQIKKRLNKKENTLIKVSLLTYKKYYKTNPNQLINALMSLKNNDYSGFTNDFGARNKLSIEIKNDEIEIIIEEILEKNNYQLEDNNIYILFNEYISSLVLKEKIKKKV